MGEPTFSVIVPAFNSRGRIGSTLRSVLAQSRRDLELIVVDDGSSDGTADEAEAFAATDPRVVVIRQENAGTATARNAGLAVARGSFVSFLDDDDLWLPGYLEAVGIALEANPGAGIAYSDAAVVDIGTGLVGRLSALERFPLRIRRLPAALNANAALRALLRVNFLTTCAVTVRASAIAQVGALDSSIRGADDWDLWLRITGAGFGIVRVDGALAVLRKRADSAGSDEAMMARNAHRTIAAAMRRPLDPGGIRVARRHLLVLDGEAAAIEHGRHVRRVLWGVLRRLGRKRVRLFRRSEWLAPSGELALALEPDGPGQPGSD